MLAGNRSQCWGGGEGGGGGGERGEELDIASVDPMGA